MSALVLLFSLELRLGWALTCSIHGCNKRYPWKFTFSPNVSQKKSQQVLWLSEREQPGRPLVMVEALEDAVTDPGIDE